MHMFYTTDFIGDKYARLDESESRHCVKVLRKRCGDVISITDGKGNCYQAEIREIKKSYTTLEILEKLGTQKPLNPPIILACAPTKNNSRFEWMVEKSVEIGVSTIFPVLCMNSERKRIKISRLRDIALSAMKQSGRYYLPQIEELIPLEKLVEQLDPADWVFLMGGQESDKRLVNMKLERKGKAVFIGPEGDFSSSEKEFMHQKGFKCVNLSAYRLRTETAAIAAVTLLSGMTCD